MDKVSKGPPHRASISAFLAVMPPVVLYYNYSSCMLTHETHFGLHR